MVSTKRDVQGLHEGLRRAIEVGVGVGRRDESDLVAGGAEVDATVKQGCVKRAKIGHAVGVDLVAPADVNLVGEGQPKDATPPEDVEAVSP